MHSISKRGGFPVALKGRQNVEKAWLLTYHEIGRLIQVHLQLNQTRADYGAQVIPRLAGDTVMSERSLYECRHFYRCFPIPRKSAELGWSHYVLLCQVVDAAQREALVVQVDPDSARFSGFAVAEEWFGRHQLAASPSFFTP